MLEKAAAIKRFGYSLLGKELKKQTSVAEKQYQKFYSAFESNKNKEDKTKNKRGCAGSNPVNSSYFIFTNIRMETIFMNKESNKKN